MLLKNINYWRTEKEFAYYGDMIVSDRLKQGVDVEVKNQTIEALIKETKVAGVYIIADSETGEVLKVGQSADIRHRIQTQYKCISNSTNNFIRESIKERFKRVSFFVYLIPNTEVELIGYTFKTNLQKGLEEAILHAYYNEYQEIPELNRQRN